MEIHEHLRRIRETRDPEAGDLLHFLVSGRKQERDELFALADRVREKGVGPGILLRGLVEFNNHCRNACGYCGLNRHNRKLSRYRMPAAEILETAAAVNAAGIRTVVLQSGEDERLETAWLADLVTSVKSRFDTAVTLAVGERPREDFRIWKQAGADRYLLKIETSDPRLYARIHPGMSFENRLRCLDDLRDLGYQVGSGVIVGLAGQSLESLAGDIRFFKRGGFSMLGIGPFIPHSRTPLAGSAPGSLDLSLRVLALTRIVCPDLHLPATTAVASLEERAGWAGALRAGANVIMPNFTPPAYRRLYDIYPDRRGGGENPGEVVREIARLADSLGRPLDFSRGDGPSAPAAPGGAPRSVLIDPIEEA
jgi:biotin synthase